MSAIGQFALLAEPGDVFVASVRRSVSIVSNDVLARNAFVTRCRKSRSNAAVTSEGYLQVLPAAPCKRSRTMSDNPNLNNRRSASTTAAREVFSPQKDLHPMNEYLTEVSSNEGDYCLMRCTLPAGAVVPMHSHADRETFYVVFGKLDALRGDRWEKLGAGDVFDVRDGTKHAWRNSSQAPASMICVTTTRMARFLQEISFTPGSSPEEHAQRFLKLVHANGYWLASPEENAAVGLEVSWSGLGDDRGAL
jgi:quercetin dioxygenase-like cupin family protein